jgi:hypothetical protein
VEGSGQLHAVAALTLGKELPVPIAKGVGRTPEPVLMLCRSDESLSHVWNQPRYLGRPVCSIVSRLAELFRFQSSHQYDRTLRPFIAFLRSDVPGTALNCWCQVRSSPASFLFFWIALVMSCAWCWCPTWHISSVFTWKQCFPEYIAHPSFESDNRRSAHRLHANRSTSVWAWRFEWRCLCSGMCRRVLWLVGTNV